MFEEEAEEYAKENYSKEVRATARNAYLDCARLKEKRIAELEKENAELQDKLKNLASVAEVRLANWQKYEKENEELKEKNKALEQYADLVDEKVDEVKSKLTKAKGIIKDYMIIVKGGNITVCSVPEENRCINVLKLNEQAEQFLKENKE